MNPRAALVFFSCVSRFDNSAACSSARGNFQSDLQIYDWNLRRFNVRSICRRPQQNFASMLLSTIY